MEWDNFPGNEGGQNMVTYTHSFSL
jgi:hypothetical protein